MSAKQGSQLLAQAKCGDFQSFSKLLTWLENAELSEIFSLEEILQPPSLAFRFGVTGPPGAGKSTLVGKLITHLRQKRPDARIGVIAVDPSSPFSRGAILGDRIRYAEHFLDPKVFIRSLGSRGSLGGLSSAAFLMARAFDGCGFDIVLIETVGVGQTELDVLHVADKVGVVLVPESGDSVQAMKAGLMEIADVFIVNKADRPGADGLAREIQAVQSDDKLVLKCVASENKGVEELAEILVQARPPLKRDSPVRLREEARALLRSQWEKNLIPVLAGVHDVRSFARLFAR